MFFVAPFSTFFLGRTSTLALVQGTEIDSSKKTFISAGVNPVGVFETFSAVVFQCKRWFRSALEVALRVLRQRAPSRCHRDQSAPMISLELSQRQSQSAFRTSSSRPIPQRSPKKSLAFSPSKNFTGSSGESTRIMCKTPDKHVHF